MSQNYIWSRAVWTEGSTEEEGTVPSNWINLEEKILFWPPFYVNPLKALRGRREPDNKWKQFPLIKVKFMSGKIS